MLAAMIDGLAESGGAGRRRLRRPGRGTRSPGRRRQQERRQPRVGALHHGDVLGRRRPAAVAAASGPRQLRDRLGRQRRAARAVRRHLGRDGDHRAGHRLGLRQHPHDRASGRRRVRPQRREDLRHLRRALRRGRGVGDPRQALGRAAIKSFVVPKGTPGHERRAARAQARHPRLRHRRDPFDRLPGAGREPARLARGRHAQRASPGRWRPSTTPARWSPRWRSAAPARRST